MPRQGPAVSAAYETVTTARRFGGFGGFVS